MTELSNRRDYIAELYRLLSVLPQEEREAACEFYDAFILDSGDEQSAIKSLGDIRDLAASVVADWAHGNSRTGTERSVPPPVSLPTTPPAYPIDAPHAPNMPPNFPVYTPKRRRSALRAAFIAILAIFAAPIGLPIAITVGVVLLAIAIVIFSVVLSFTAVGIAFVPGGIGLAIMGLIVLPQSIPTALFSIGSGLVMLGIGYFITKYTFITARFLFRKLTNTAGKVIVRSRRKHENRNTKTREIIS